MSKIDKRIKEIKARLLAATPGPWKHSHGMIYGRSIGGCQMEMSDFRVADIRGWGHLQYLGETRGMEIQNANGDLVAHAPSDLEFLLSELEKRC